LETVVFTEKKKSIIADLIVMVLFVVLPIGWFIYIAVELSHSETDSSIGFPIFFICILLIPLIVVVAGYAWDIKAEITLSNDSLTIFYGRKIFDFVPMRPKDVILWNKIEEITLTTHSYESSSEGGGSTKITNYSLFVSGKRVRYSLGLNNRFEQSPDEILKLCNQYLEEFGNTNTSK
jgi:hypothetical protein